MLFQDGHCIVASTTKQICGVDWKILVDLECDGTTYVGMHTNLSRATSAA